MKKLILFTILFTFLLATASANISLINQPNEIYNLQDQIELHTKITPAGELSNLVTIYLNCRNGEIEAYKEFLQITQETEKQILIPLVKEYIKDLNGNCKIDYRIGDNEKKTLSDNFKISNQLIVKIQTNGEQFEPGKTIQISGTALRENQKKANGIIEAKINSIESKSEIINGEFTLSFDIPDNFKAGEHNIKINAYEQDKNNEITNKKETQDTIIIKQIPTNLEIILEQKEIIPGETLNGKILLRDQTGEKINAKAYIAIKNELNEFIEKIETETNDDFDFQIEEAQKPTSWTVAAYSKELITKVNFEILPHEKIETNIINKTLVIKNKGNVPYNKTVPVKIGDQTIEVETNLDVGQSEKYSLTAPQGQYQIEVQGTKAMMSLTGNAIRVEKISPTRIGMIKLIAWIFLFIILGLATYVFYTNVKKKTFKGKKTGKKAKKPLEQNLKEIPQPEKLIATKTKGQISTSISGGKQNLPLGCLYLKNYEQIRFGKGGVRETLQEIGNYIESLKGIIYENKGNIFFMIPPTRTRTFENEENAIKIAKFIQNKINEHNKKFAGKIKYGLSLNYGTIVSNETKESFKFMTMGTLIGTAKKLSKLSNGEILMGEYFAKKAKDKIKVQKKQEIEEINAYEFKEMKIKEDHSEFLNNFIKKHYK